MSESGGDDSNFDHIRVVRGTSAYATRNRARRARAHTRAVRAAVVYPIIVLLSLLILFIYLPIIRQYSPVIYTSISTIIDRFTQSDKDSDSDLSTNILSGNSTSDSNVNSGINTPANAIIDTPVTPPAPEIDTTNLTMFRGNPARSLSGVGTVPRHPKLLWRFKTRTKLEGPYEKRGSDKLNEQSPWPGLGWTGQPVRLGNRIYFGSSDSRVYCIDLGRYGIDTTLSGTTDSTQPVSTPPAFAPPTSDPRLVWYYETHHCVKGSIAIFDSFIYHGGRDNKIHCYNLDGEMVWETRTGNDMDSSPVVVDGKGYIGGEDHNIYCFDPKTGEIVWKFEGASGSFEDSPCVYDDSVVLGTSRGILFCVDKNTGKLKWKRTTSGDTDSTPVYSKGRLYVSCATGDENETGYYWCIDAETGGTIWQKSFKRGFWATAAINEGSGTLYIGNNNGIFYCLRMSDGEALWKRNLGSRIWGSAAVTDKCVIVGVRDGRVWCLAEGTGKPLWVFDCGGDIDATPLVAGGLIVIGNQDGWVYCIGEGIAGEETNTNWFITEFPEKMLTAKGATAWPSIKRTSHNSTGIYTIDNPSPAPGTYTDTNSGSRENYLKPVYGNGWEG